MKVYCVISYICNYMNREEVTIEKIFTDENKAKEYIKKHDGEYKHGYQTYFYIIEKKVE